MDVIVYAEAWLGPFGLKNNPHGAFALVSSRRRAIQMTNRGVEFPKWKVILSFPRWMRGVDTMRVATLESPDLECPMTTPLFFAVQSQPEVPHSLVRNNNNPSSPQKLCIAVAATQ